MHVMLIYSNLCTFQFNFLKNLFEIFQKNQIKNVIPNTWEFISHIFQLVIELMFVLNINLIQPE